MDKNELKKDLYRSKTMAKFSHYTSGNLYYSVEALGAKYLFPIQTTEEVSSGTKEDSSKEVSSNTPNIKLSSDLGTTAFLAEIRGYELIRWISKAIDSGDFVSIPK